MNYLTEIKLFYDWLETHELSPTSIALWHGLMHIANRSGWKSPLRISASLIEFRTGIPRSTLKRERKKLIEAGLLSVEFGKGRSRTSYRLCSLAAHFTAQYGLQREPQCEPQNNERVQLVAQIEPQVVPSILYKLNYTEINKENIKETTTNREQSSLLELPRCEGVRQSQKNESEKMEVGADAPPCLSPEEKKERKSCAKKKQKREAPQFDTYAILQTIEPPWRELMQSWVEYKRLRKDSYRSEIGIRKCLTLLRNLSANNPHTASMIIDQSIANNWAGLFEVKGSSYQARGQPTTNREQSSWLELPRCEGGRRSQPATGQRIGQIKQPDSEEHKNRILEKFGKHKK